MIQENWRRLLATVGVLIALSTITFMGLDASAQNQPFELEQLILMEMEQALPSDIVPHPDQLQNVKIDPQLRASVERLDDVSFKVREEATARLLDAATDKWQLYALLAGDDLSPEQRYRLLGVMREHLIKTPRGAIGISMDSVMVQAGGPIEIRVTELLPGLPAERVLQVGDRISHLDGQPFTMRDELQIRVQSKRPGEKVMLTVKRSKVDEHGELILDANNQVAFDTMQIEIALGSADLLRNIRGPVSQSRVVQDSRTREANQAAQKFGPQPRSIEVKGGAAAIGGRQADSQTQSHDAEELLAAASDASVDRHPAIRNLIMQRKLIMQGALKVDDNIRQTWQKHLNDLVQLGETPNLSQAQQQYLYRVVQRYKELMHQ